MLESDGKYAVEYERKGFESAIACVEDPEHLVGETGSEGFGMKAKKDAIDGSSDGFHARLGLASRSRDLPSRTTEWRRSSSSESIALPCAVRR